MSMLRVLKKEFLLVTVILALGGLVGWVSSLANAEDTPPIELVQGDLEPFRAAFNAAADDVRAILLVGPT
jgi:hypothetical protein